MKQISEIVQGYVANPAKREPVPLTPQEKDSIAFFFMRLKLVYPQQYDAAMPDEKSETFAKREYGKHLAAFSREQISVGFDRLHKLRQGASWQDWRFMDIDRVISLIRDGESGDASDWEHARIKAADRERLAERLLPDLGKQERARAAGKKALAEMMARLGSRSRCEGTSGDTGSEIEH